MLQELKHLKSFLSADQIVTDRDQLQLYGTDWLKFYLPNPCAVLFPKSRKNVEDIVQWALRFNRALVPSGGRTGLSGAASASNKEVVVSFDKMNQVIKFNEMERSLCVQPGVITKTVQEIAKDKSLYFPLSFASEGSSQIGGNVATNAGGVHVIRYGSLRKWVLGLEVVTGEGKTLCLGRGLIKNTAGYDLMNLFIGSEGTLGFITEITLQLTHCPSESPCVLLLAVSDVESLSHLYNLFKTKCSLRAFEVFTTEAVKYVQKISLVNFPLKVGNYYALLECDSTDQESVLALFELAHQKKYILDGVMSESSQQAAELWSFRENISESLSAFLPYKNDISIRPSLVPKFIDKVNVLLKKEYPDFPVVWFGHLGDGNLHINILPSEKENRENFLQKCTKVNDLLFNLVNQFKGSVSAEHGVGLLKKDYLHYSCSKEEIQYMRSVKKIFDPKGILNPGKIFD